MNETVVLILSTFAGAALGAVFFGGLWWTVRKGLASEKAALWFISSLLLRTVIVLIGFYYVSAGQWQRLLLCLLGFAISRPIVTRLTRPTGENPPRPATEVIHASDS